jgi:hypothetical protein
VRPLWDGIDDRLGTTTRLLNGMMNKAPTDVWRSLGERKEGVLCCFRWNGLYCSAAHSRREGPKRSTAGRDCSRQQGGGVRRAISTWLSGALVVLCMAGQSRAQDTNVSQVFRRGEGGYYIFRIPSLIACTNGTLLAFAEGRPNFNDFGNIDIVMKRSTNSGVSWEPLRVLGNYSNIINDGLDLTIGSPTAVLDGASGRVLLLAQTADGSLDDISIGIASRRVWITETADNGQTWAAWREITGSVDPANWGWFVTGPGHGIQLGNGIHSGRLIVPVNYAAPVTSTSVVHSAACIYSDDGGVNWQLGAVDGIDTEGNFNAGETCVVELAGATNGQSRLYFNTRKMRSVQSGNRGRTYSTDSGLTFTNAFGVTREFVVPLCEGSLLRFSFPDTNGSGGRIVFSCPNHPTERKWLSVWVSRDETVSWREVPRRIWDGPSGYSDLTLTAGGDLGVLFEDAVGNMLFRSVNAAWLDESPPASERPNEGLWTFGESSPGQSTTPGVADIMDHSPAGYGLNLTASGSFGYIAGPCDSLESVSLSFDGTGGLWVYGAGSGLPFNFYANDSFTVETQVRIPPSETFGAIVAKDYGSHEPSWWLRVQEGGYVRFQICDFGGIEQSVRSAQLINDGTWHRVAAVRDATARQLRVYVDGVLSAQGTDGTIAGLANGGPLCIGRFGTRNDSNLSGDIDFVRITPAALTPSQFLSWLPPAAPVAGSDTIQRFAAGGTKVNVAGLLVNDTDANGDHLTISGVGSNSAAGGTVGLTNNWVYYAPPPGFTNGDTFTYTVSDGRCDTGLGTVTVQIKPDDVRPSNFSIQSLGDGSIRLTFGGIPGYAYRIEYTEGLSPANWQTLATPMVDAFGAYEHVDRPPANAPSRFYRLFRPGSGSFFRPLGRVPAWANRGSSNP